MYFSGSDQFTIQNQNLYQSNPNSAMTNYKDFVKQKYLNSLQKQNLNNQYFLQKMHNCPPHFTPTGNFQTNAYLLPYNSKNINQYSSYNCGMNQFNGYGINSPQSAYVNNESPQNQRNKVCFNNKNKNINAECQEIHRMLSVLNSSKFQNTADNFYVNQNFTQEITQGSTNDNFRNQTRIQVKKIEKGNTESSKKNESTLIKSVDFLTREMKEIQEINKITNQKPKRIKAKKIKKIVKLPNLKKQANLKDQEIKKKMEDKYSEKEQAQGESQERGKGQEQEQGQGQDTCALDGISIEKEIEKAICNFLETPLNPDLPLNRENPSMGIVIYLYLQEKVRNNKKLRSGLSAKYQLLEGLTQEIRKGITNPKLSNWIVSRKYVNQKKFSRSIRKRNPNKNVTNNENNDLYIPKKRCL
ncbi:hypothetical protein M0813_14004 [Anaeramoeba flamelloides]|uniref:Uncharacterized protein n=1 Tax=Anaeramoeba flamelloides TaxID=1746091 RepID=A0ABQ8Z6V9_9EUKA|nr:hypothetical protein M0813_14004 [Anaeramoeba flamelloides]